MEKLAGRVAVITGGAQGIGLATAKRLGAEGMRVVLADINEAALGAARESLERAGVEVLAVPTDVTSAEQVAALARQTLARFARVHVVFNNAGIGLAHPLWQTPELAWRKTIEVNLWGVIHGLRTFVPLLIEQGEGGHLVSTASLAGLGPAPGLGAYCATKYAVVGLMETLYAELSAIGSPIGVSVLCPGFVHTGILENSEFTSGSRNQADGPLQPFFRALVDGISGGVAPSEIAELVCAGIRHNRFWLLPAGAAEVMKPRLDALREGRNPVAPTPETLGRGEGRAEGGVSAPAHRDRAR